IPTAAGIFRRAMPERKVSSISVELPVAPNVARAPRPSVNPVNILRFICGIRRSYLNASPIHKRGERVTGSGVMPVDEILRRDRLAGERLQKFLQPAFFRRRELQWTDFLRPADKSAHRIATPVVEVDHVFEPRRLTV